MTFTHCCFLFNAVLANDARGRQVCTLQLKSKSTANAANKKQAPLSLRTRQRQLHAHHHQEHHLCVKDRGEGSPRSQWVHPLCSTVQHCRGHQKLPRCRGVWEVRIRGNEKGRKRQKEITEATESKRLSVKAKQKISGRFSDEMKHSLKSWASYMDSLI